MYVDLRQGIALTAGMTVCYNPLLRPLIKYLEEADASAFKNFVTSEICMITWLTECKVQIVPQCIYVWSNGIHYSFASYSNPRCYPDTKVIADTYELNQIIIATVKAALSSF